jgi:hypothetical protein
MGPIGHNVPAWLSRTVLDIGVISFDVRWRGVSVYVNIVL